MTDKQDYVAGLLFSNDAKRVALVLKNRPLWQKDHFNAIGGKVEPGETWYPAMVREFREETGLLFEDWQTGPRLVGDFGIVQFFYGFSDDVFKVKTMESEPIVVATSDILPINVVPNLKWLIPMILQLGPATMGLEFRA